MKLMKGLTFIILFNVYAKFTYAQFGVKNIVLSVEVKCIDSQYVFIPHLRILDNEIIRIHKRLYYGNEATITADCKFYLQKLVGKHYQNIYVFALSHPLPDKNFYEFNNFTKRNSLKDTVNLQEFIGLDINEYRLSIEFSYYSKGLLRKINADWVTFNVLFKPKGSIFD